MDGAEVGSGGSTDRVNFVHINKMKNATQCVNRIENPMNIPVCKENRDLPNDYVQTDDFSPSPDEASTPNDEEEEKEVEEACVYQFNSPSCLTLIYGPLEGKNGNTHRSVSTPFFLPIVNE